MELSVGSQNVLALVKKKKKKTLMGELHHIPQKVQVSRAIVTSNLTSAKQDHVTVNELCSPKFCRFRSE